MFKSSSLLVFFLILVVISSVFLGLNYFYPQIFNTFPAFNLKKPQIQSISYTGKVPDFHNTFGFNILGKLYQEDQTSNIIISPSSISLALSMIYNGAQDSTKQAMEQTLQIQGITIDDLNKQSQTLINLLKNPDPKVEIDIANSIWIDAKYAIKPDFIATNENYYSALVQKLDLLKPEAVNIINTWVNNNTKGKIPTIVNNIDPSTVMFLINAIYFNGTWTEVFKETQTQNKKFTLNNSQSKTIPMMANYSDYKYTDNNNFQAIYLPYGDNKRLGMYVFLPKRNISSFISSLNNATLTSWLDSLTFQEGTIILPKFKLTYEKNLNKVLEELGMSIAFQQNANFDGAGKDLFISEVKHKTFIDVNEKGTEAAAVTSVKMMQKSAFEPKKTFTMEVNKPFFFIIQDTQTKEIIFTGIIQDPSATE